MRVQHGWFADGSCHELCIIIEEEASPMKRLAVTMLTAALLLATDRSGLRPRGAAKDYPAYDSAGGITIAAAVVPASKVQHQLSREMVTAGYTVLEVAIYPDPGKN